MLTPISSFTHRRGIFYGWWVSWAASIHYMLNTSAFTYGFSLFVVPLAQEYGWSRTQMSAVWTSALALTLASQPFAGWAVDRYGPRRVALVAGPLVGIGWMATALLKLNPSYWFFFTIFVLFIGIGLQTGLVLPGQVAVARWFRFKRARAMGNVSVGAGIAGVAALPLMALTIRTWGWAVGALAVGITVIVGSIAMALVLRRDPESYGMAPDGEAAPPASYNSRTAGMRTAEAAFSTSEALKTAAFWMLTMALFMRFVGIATVSLHLVPYLIDKGLNTGLAAFVLGLGLAMSIPGRLAFGWMGDRLDKRKVMAGCLFLQALAILTALFASPSGTYLIYMYAILWGLGSGAEPLSNALRADLFGRVHFGKISGIQTPLGQAGRLVGAVIGGVLFDASGSYQIAFLIGAAASVLAVPLAALTPQPKKSRDAILSAPAEGDVRNEIS